MRQPESEHQLRQALRGIGLMALLALTTAAAAGVIALVALLVVDGA